MLDRSSEFSGTEARLVDVLPHSDSENATKELNKEDGTDDVQEEIEDKEEDEKA